MTSAYDIILRPIVTEKSIDGLQQRKYTFEVARSANKIEIAKAAEEIFGIKVENVTTINVHPKPKRLGNAQKFGKTSSWKKAVIKATPASKTIEFFDGMM